MKTVLLGNNEVELKEWSISQGQPSFRGNQLYDWIYNKGAKSFSDISVFPKTWRNYLNAQNIQIGRLNLLQTKISKDLTTKILLGTDDGEVIEAVGIPTNKRLTVCLSSQVGCPMACRFCSTGINGYKRSLMTHEIVDQALSVREVMNRRPSHAVFMGMGEPLLNIEAVLDSIRCLTDILGISQRRITLSTVGISKSLPNLAISLHAPNQKLREKLIPSAQAYPLDLLIRDSLSYYSKTGRRISFEYILIGNVNDYSYHAEELSELLGILPCHVNLIPYNPVEDEDFVRPSKDRIKAFKEILEIKRFKVSLRASRGLDQNAACGQLRRHFKDC